MHHMARPAGRRRSLRGPLAVFLLLALITLPALAGGEKPDFSGSWELNEDLSDNPWEKMMEKMPERGSGGPPGGGRGGKGGGGGGYDSGRSQMARDRMRSLLESAKRLDIAHAEPSLSMVDGEGNERLLFTDGRDNDFELAGDLWEASAKWKKGTRVVLKAKSTRGRKITEAIELSEEGRQLFITVKMDGGGRMPSFEFRRVYDPAPATQENELPARGDLEAGSSRGIQTSNDSELATSPDSNR
jgi:hypothetical protein